MIADEATLQHIEAHIPELARAAGTKAYWATLAAGHSVLESKDGVIYETFPDGTRREVKRITPPVPVTPGTKRVLR